MIDGIISAVSILVMAKARIGHFVEAQILQSLGIDYIDESEVLTPEDYANPHRQAEVSRPVRVRCHQHWRGVPSNQLGHGHDSFRW
ncbi:hypothetical protein P9209_15910 [Prescottella defluvii]|nr:hypothetical protein P9209_15910 [Prescottella defluvii]